MSDEGLLPAEERRRLLEANAAAARFYRRELLRATDSWPVQYLKWWGAEGVLSRESAWKVGYAPSTWTSLVDHLRGHGFGSFFFDRVRAMGLPAGYTPASLALTDGGAGHLHDVLSTPLPLMTYRSGASPRVPSQALDSNPPDLGPDL
jgi:hypothetical protein